MPAPADWQLPPGVSRAVWEYATDSTMAAGYDAALAGTPLLAADLALVRQHLPANGRIIDLGCGTGRAAIPLAEAGYDVVGVDLSQPMLKMARAKDNQQKVEWACGNIVDLAAFRDHSFDAAICLFSTLGMIAGAAARVRAVAEVRRLLKPGGVYIVHAHQPGHHLRTRGTWGIWWRDRWRRCRGHADAGDVTMPADQGRSGWTMHLFTRRELVRLLQDGGFEPRQVLALDVAGGVVPRWRGALAYGLLAVAVAGSPRS